MKTAYRTFLLATSLLASAAQASTTLQDNFSGAAASLNWTAIGGACLTAGDGTGTIPACKTLAYYSGQTQTGLTNNADPANQGALRLTNGCVGSTCYYQQAGAIVSNTTYPADQGVQVTFTAYAYGGDNSGGHGADGIGFYIMDAAQAPNIGSWGGSLGYTCSNVNTPFTGMTGGYLGLGMDEYGNFLNQGDNTASGYGAHAGRIGLRGAGNVSWAWLTANYPAYYPSSLGSTDQQAAVQSTCSTGYLWNYSSPTQTCSSRHGHTTCSGGPVQTATPVADYAPIPNAYLSLPSSTPLAQESATSRAQANPISYKLNVTPAGLLSLAYSYNGGAYVPVLTNQSITTANGALPANLRFGFGGSTGGSDNVHEITCFQAAQANQSASSAGFNTQQSSEVKTGTQVYLAFFHPDNWWGQLTSQNLVVNPTSGAVTISPTVNWDASCVLTGGTCLTTGATGMAAQASRNLFTWTGSAGVALAWNSISPTEQGWLNAGDSQGSARLSYLTGDRSNEVTTSGTGAYRTRTSLLGDIIDSSPAWVGAPASPYGATWQDHLAPTATFPENSGQTYAQYQTAQATRQDVVYVGSNDGFMHGFSAGAYDSSGAFVATQNTGAEVVGYMPQAVLQAVHNAADATLDYSSVHYSHAYYMDATPGSGDLYYGGAWHTWLVSGLGYGGAALFALDVTDPAAFSSTGASKVMGEWNASTLSCANVTGCGTSLGQTTGTPQIRRLHNGNWAVLFGNGLNSASGHAGLYVMVLSGTTGLPTATYFLDVGVGSAATPNGIGFVTPVDLDGDHITDYVYAGDVQGNIWRFDLTSSNPASWAVSSYGQPGPTPLAALSGQPVSTAVAVVKTPTASGGSQVMVEFGTGNVVPQTTLAPVSYAKGQQSLYGVQDWDMTGWNSLGSTQFVSKASNTAPLTRSNFATQTITSEVAVSNQPGISGYRTVSNNALTAGQSGWLLDLTGYHGVTGVGAANQTEQVVYSPVLQNGTFMVSTVIPANNTPFQCTSALTKGWTMALDPATGGGGTASAFADAAGNPLVSGGAPVAGVDADATGKPTVVTTLAPNSETFLVSQTVTGTGFVQRLIPKAAHGGRVTWIEVR